MAKKRKNSKNKAETAPVVKRPLFIASLLMNEAEVLAQVISIFPLLLGCWIAGGLMLNNSLLFTLVLGSIVIAHLCYLASPHKEAIPFNKEFFLLLYAAQFGLCGLFYYFSEQLEGSLLMLASASLLLLTAKLPYQSPRCIIAHALMLPVRMSILAILGAFCQYPVVFIQSGILGLVPGLVLAAALVAKFSSVLENEGWKKSTQITRENGETQVRPGGILRLFSFFLFLGPAIPVSLVPFAILPNAFLISVLLLYFAPKMAQEYLQGVKNSGQTAVRVTLLAGLSVILMLVAGLAARYFPEI